MTIKRDYAPVERRTKIDALWTVAGNVIIGAIVVLGLAVIIAQGVMA